MDPHVREDVASDPLILSGVCVCLCACLRSHGHVHVCVYKLYVSSMGGWVWEEPLYPLVK